MSAERMGDGEGEEGDSFIGVKLFLTPTQVAACHSVWKTRFQNIDQDHFPTETLVGLQYVNDGKFKTSLDEEQRKAIEDHIKETHNGEIPVKPYFSLRAETGKPDVLRDAVALVAVTFTCKSSATRTNGGGRQRQKQTQQFSVLTSEFREEFRSILRAVCTLEDDTNRDSMLNLIYLLQGSTDWGTDAVLETLKQTLSRCMETETDEEAHKRKKRKLSAWQMYVSENHSSIATNSAEGINITVQILAEQWKTVKANPEDLETWQKKADARCVRLRNNYSVVYAAF